MADINLKFDDFWETFHDLGKGEWVTVFQSKRNSKEWESFYCALIAEERVKESLSDSSWDLQIGHGLPTYIFHNGEKLGTYSRFSDERIEPLIIWRSFNTMKEGYWEVSEEFRLYFNLYEDKRNKNFIFIDGDCEDEEIISISDQEIKIKLRFIREFLAAKKMRLALFFNFFRFSDKTLKDLGIQKYRADKRGKDFVYSTGVDNGPLFLDKEKKSIGFLIGKKLISAKKDFEPDLYNRDRKKAVEFIIGVDKDGQEITNTCNQQNYIIPVFFRKEVMRKYFEQPTKYSVEDGCLMRGGIRMLLIDNNHTDYIMVFLGDLGRLSYNEQMYWRSFNIATTSSISETAYKRKVLGQYAEPESSDLIFKAKFSSFQSKWEKKYGWHLFKPPGKNDEHYFKKLRVPLTIEQSEFDDQVLALVQVLIESLNETDIGKNLEIRKQSPKGIDKLECFLLSKNLTISEPMEFFRNLQSLRSAAVAHRKGKKYEKTKQLFSNGEDELPQVFNNILIKATWTLIWLENNLLKN